MKYLFSLLFIVSFLAVRSQSTDSTIEVRLTLIQQTDSQKVKSLALAVSIINHSNKDLYIPGFELYSVNYYKKTDTSAWREIDIGTHDYYQAPSCKIGPVNTIMNDYYARYLDQSNAVKATCLNNRNLQFQRELTERYTKEAKLNRYIWSLAGRPFFIKAGEEIKYYRIDAVDYLLNSHCDYKIAFNSEKRGRQFPTRERMEQYFHFPDMIYGYALYFPKSFIANIIYYTTVDMELNGK